MPDIRHRLHARHSAFERIDVLFPRGTLRLGDAEFRSQICDAAFQHGRHAAGPHHAVSHHAVSHHALARHARHTLAAVTRHSVHSILIHHPDHRAAHHPLSHGHLSQRS